MDSIDADILMRLQSDARLSMTSLGKLIGLSQPAITERVKRLEEQEVIKSYRAIVSNEKVGKSTVAFVLFRTTKCNNFVDYCKQASQVVECHRISGEYNYLIKVVVESTKELELFENDSMKYGDSTTLISLSSPIENKSLIPNLSVE
ncbi:MAG TPA: Lrp/AsnC family transcriptional regulator [Lysinibacillus sp.]|uniref:Lrp/AsnC family transcriptional regulator n=1 Tax=Lysinibacillus fusiformis TaxID=28031 RepID=A0A2I0V0L5_9BACI|nr:MULTISPECIES: Lrp/AsnC family transcriptional regulator [Lysinibacillus]HBT71963.1 Lrp/AsnC family transcriptional regulator [Lysinibacillus sp.]KUF32007.1 AsnC family transcriptional regulator [Lysinibacillus sp. F5]MEE3806216.1 Lrp/AsnC family transcriptional regulator [Lysinibacillus fusiformis]PKU51762.1 Lrp/AsnC family transcriptional regulator [Lysinibacillus fusiformis]SCY29976.1 DNA-binding transcriptional regulator, Lrp family [Lysinibacillus sp. SG9]